MQVSRFASLDAAREHYASALDECARHITERVSPAWLRQEHEQAREDARRFLVEDTPLVRQSIEAHRSAYGGKAYEAALAIVAAHEAERAVIDALRTMRLVGKQIIRAAQSAEQAHRSYETYAEAIEAIG